jgi:hypothetical protein
VSKKLIIITAAAGLVSFGGAFVFGWLTKPSPVSPPDELSQPTVAGAGAEMGLARPGPGAVDTVVAVSDTAKKAMPEKQLKALVYEIREKIQEYDDKLQGLEIREQRLQVAQDVLKKDIEDLNNLRIELASIIASLKEERDSLLKDRIEISNAEKANLVTLAAAYDKMDVSGAGKILTSMCADQTQDGKADSRSSGFDEAVKILYYMTERTKAKLLAELATLEPKLAAALSQRLKQIIEGK